MLISELAERTGLPVHTIRFYEKEYLIDERFFVRSENRYRHYTEAAVERIEMIKHGQAAGYTLSEVRDLLQAWDAGELTTETQIEHLEEKLYELTHKISELEKIKHYLSNKLVQMRTANSETDAKLA